MKIIAAASLAVALTIPHLCSAESPDVPPGETPGSKPHRGAEERRRPLPGPGPWKSADLDRDGKISRGEFDALPRAARLSDEKREALFRRLDRDGDGFLGKKELTRGPQRVAGPRGIGFRQLDADRNGEITKEEFLAGSVISKLPPERQGELFRRMDANGDGIITPSDHPRRSGKPAGQAARPKGAGWFPKGSDLNGDGSVTLEEFLEKRQAADSKHLERFFRKLDRNSDGVITKDEVPARDPQARENTEPSPEPDPADKAELPAPRE